MVWVSWRALAELSDPVLTLLAIYCVLLAHVVCRLLLSRLPWYCEWIAITWESSYLKEIQSSSEQIFCVKQLAEYWDINQMCYPLGQFLQSGSQMCGRRGDSTCFPPHTTARENCDTENANEESQMVSYSWSCAFHSVVLSFLLCSHLYLQCYVARWRDAEASRKHGKTTEEENPSFVQNTRFGIKAEEDLTSVISGRL